MNSIDDDEVIHANAAIVRAIGRLEGRIEAFLTNIDRHETRIDQLEERQRSLENFRNKVITIGIVLSTFISAVSAIFATQVLNYGVTLGGQ